LALLTLDFLSLERDAIGLKSRSRFLFDATQPAFAGRSAPFAFPARQLAENFAIAGTIPEKGLLRDGIRPFQGDAVLSG
jgi:hypothetical protein